MSDKPESDDLSVWYASPKTESLARANEEEAPQVFFAVSTLKLGVLSFCTVGLYQYYWFYKNWQHIAGRGASIRPAARAFFTVFYCYGLFQDMRRVLQGTASRAPFPAGLLAIVWIVLTLAARLPEPYWLITFVNCVPLLFIQEAVNEANAARAPSAPTNGNFSPLNILACVFGSAFLVLLAFAMFDPAGLAALGN